MTDARSTFQADVFTLPLDEQFPIFIDEQRAHIARSLDGLTEQEARTQLVPSLTTPLGIVKHATYVELVWFEETMHGIPRSTFDIATDIDSSFTLSDADTIESISTRYRRQCDRSREIMATVTLDTIVTSSRLGPLPVRWVYLHLLRELAQHSGHADILREQLLATRG